MSGMSVVDLLRPIGTHPRVEPHVSRALRAALTHAPARFFVNDLRGTAGRYRVRATGQHVRLQHGTPDVATFDQTYYRHDHQPPERADAALTATGPLRVLDVGANIGLWSLWIAHRHRIASLTAVEPVARNVGALRANLADNLPAGSWSVLEAAATTSDGELSFGGADTTRGHIGGQGSTVAAVDLFGLLDGVDLLKLDVEGAEWAIVADHRWEALSVPVVMLEHHPLDAPGDPASSAEDALRRAGYACERTAGEADGTGVLWGVRTT